MKNLMPLIKQNQYIQIVLGLSLIIVVAFILFGANNSTSAQEDYTGQRWEYVEVNFNTPITFGDNVESGYFVSGNYTQSGNLLVGDIIRFYGDNGFELVTVSGNQIFIFKRPIE